MQENYKSKIKNIIKILEKRELVFLFIILLLSSFGMIFEFLSIASIPLFFSTLFDLDLKIDFLKRILNFNTTSLSSINYILFFILIIFFLKASFLFFLKIFEFVVYKRIRLRLSKILIEKYIKPDFNSELRDTSATKIWKLEIINNLSALIENSILILRNSAYIFIIIFFLIFFSNKQVIYFIFFLFLFVIIYYSLVSKKLKKTGELADLGKKDKINIIQDIINGIKDINILKRFNFFLEKFKTSNITFEKYTQKNLVLSNLPVFYLEFFGVLIIVLFFLYLNSNNLKTIEIISSISVIAYAGIRIVGLLKTCLYSFSFYKKSSFIIEVLFNEFFKKSKNANNKNLIEYRDFLENDKILNIKSLSYSYASKKEIFKNLNLEFYINKIYCLKGDSGAGKSTFLDLILGLKNFNDGKILIDCSENEIGYVPQECYLKDDTIKNNIAFGINEKSIDMDKIIKATKEAQIFDFINSLPEKFDTKLSTFGSNISVGQKQRIGIARTLYNNPKILLLDEPTSSLDFETEKNFFITLQKIKKERLIIMTTHKTNIQDYIDHTLELKEKSIYLKENT
tara:strand:- start:10253 stop:11959 length:1707 start_codon:yes stop_codon:yes gene_type:complete